MYDILRDQLDGNRRTCEPNFAQRMRASRAGMNVFQLNERHGFYRGTESCWDILDRAFGDHAPEAQGRPENDEPAWLPITRLREPESASLSRAWHDKAGYMGLVLGELSRIKAERKAEEVPF